MSRAGRNLNNTVYLLCARTIREHYLGYTGNLDRRLRDHYTASPDTPGNLKGSKQTVKWNTDGVPYGLARTWPGGDRNLEHVLSFTADKSKLCPLCTPNARRINGNLVWHEKYGWVWYDDLENGRIPA